MSALGFLDFVGQHGLSVLIVVGAAVAGAWIFAERS